jgi:serine/threonine protein kinase
MSDQPPLIKKPEVYKLWIRNAWYIPVDSSGRCVGPCAEGALGFIVQLLSDRKKDYSLALKIPRLMGETHRENAYISDLMEKELRSVEDIMLTDGMREGLLPTESLLESGGPVRGQIKTDNGPPDARSWDGSIVLVCFEKGVNPRFCLVKKDKSGTGLERFPPDTRDFPLTNPKLFEVLLDCSFKDNYPWSLTVFIELGEEQIGEQTPTKPVTRIFNEEQALKVNPTGKTWYTSLPSVAYWWAPGTLQEAISLYKRGESWDITQHLSLAETLCKGLHSLHSRGKLHADLRPANIAYLGDPSRPGNYYLSDYGSFAESGARASERNPQGGTVLGPIVGTERASSFYAPERRAGREREAADTAVVIKWSGGNTLYVVLGWRSDLIDGKTPNVSLDEKDLLERFEKIEEKPSIDDVLVAGDRIQIREYIFDVLKAAEVDGKQVLRCKEGIWKIYHGRIVVKNTDPFNAVHWFPIPRTIELLQWSAATDLYGLGAMVLYSVYRNASPRLTDDSGKIEQDFRRMLSYLESKPYFQSVWPDLEQMRKYLESMLSSGDKLSPEQFANHRRADDGNSVNQTLQKETIDVVSRITQTVPGTRRLAEVFDFNPAHFIFFIHFILCCLHRRNHLDGILDEKGIQRDVADESPFCEDRREIPYAKGGAKRALDRLNKIISFITDRRLLALKTTPVNIPEFDPRPDPTIRIAYSYLLENVGRTVNAGRSLVHRPITKIIRTKKVQAIFDEIDQVSERSKSANPGGQEDEQVKERT